MCACMCEAKRKGEGKKMASKKKRHENVSAYKQMAGVTATSRFIP